MRTKFLTAIISIALLISVFGTSMASATLTTSTPIVINGNTDLDSYPGAGTASDPKVIANLSIDGSGGAGISITNVNLYVTIFNCTIYNANYGIQIVGSSNILVDNNTITGAAGTHGIYLDSSTATLERNKLTGCSIELRHVDSNSGVQAYIDATAISSTNTVNGAAVFFLKNQNMDNASVPSGAGEVILLNVTYANVNGLNNHGGVVIFWSSHITVENSVITGAYDAIYSFSSNYCTYTNNQIVDAWHAGIRLYLSSHNAVSGTVVTHQVVYSTAYGIVVMYSTNNVIAGSTVKDTFDGIALSYSNNNNVTDSRVNHSTGNGIYIEASNNNNVSNNIVNGSSFRGIFTQLSNGNVLYNNTVVGALDCGISLWKSFGNTVNRNKIFNSLDYGINLTECTGAVDLIYTNVLIGNNGSTSVYSADHIQAHDDASNRWNGTIGNYWGDWATPDANKDGIVDSSYAIAGGLSVDNHPVALSVKILSPPSNLYTNATSIVLSGTTTGYIIADVTWHNLVSGASGQGSGISSWTATATLVLGINNITVNATDSQGLMVSDNVTIVLKTLGSNLTIIMPSNNSYNTTGSVKVQWNTSEAASLIDKTEISSDGTTWTPVTGNSTILTLADGAYTVTVKVTDKAGNVNQTSVAFTVDTVKPVVVITSPSNNSKNTTGSVTVNWTSSDATSGIDKTEISTDGTTWTTVTGNSHVLTLADGTYTTYVKVTDKAGNFNQTSVTFTVDTVKPVVVVISPANNSYNNTGTVTVLWNDSGVVDIAKTEISTDGTTWTPVTGNSTVLTLADGAYQVHIKVTDNAGNVNQTSVAFTVDTVKPVVVITSPSNNTVNITGSVTVSWEASDATSGIDKVELSTDGTTWTNVTGNSRVLTLADGPYTITVKATDKAGNVNQTSVSLTVESSTPTVTDKTPIGNVVPRGATIAVQFSEPMNKTATTISVNGVIRVLTWNGNNATYTPSSALAYNTTYTVTVSGKDLSGKELATVSWSFTTMKDEGKITCTLKDASGKAVAGAKVTLSNGMSATTDANGYFELKNVTSGSYTLTISKDGYKTVTQSVSTAAGETTALGTLSALASESSSDNTLLIAGGAIGIIALLAAAFLLLQRRKKK
ncbi:MAG TPA: right-handed parallel beta-helix repeat-containing protein [Methanomassiliicoccales archaeon]|jgi:parallel beta-helix repeat protein